MICCLFTFHCTPLRRILLFLLYKHCLARGRLKSSSPVPEPSPGQTSASPSASLLDVICSSPLTTLVALPLLNSLQLVLIPLQIKVEHNSLFLSYIYSNAIKDITIMLEHLF